MSSSLEPVTVFNVLAYGAKGDGDSPDHGAFQRAIDAAAKAGPGARVLVPTGRRYLIGAIVLRGSIDFHIEGDAEVIASTRAEDYGQALPTDGLINPVDHSMSLFRAENAGNLRISGSGSINGRARLFMTKLLDDWWLPQLWRPRIFLLTGVTGLEITGITIVDSPSWTVHLLGCENVLIDGITIRNPMDIPNCDGINPDHCRNVEIRNCTISGGDDSIVVKTSRPGCGYGPSAHIHVHDCVLESRSSALKIGSESAEDIYGVVFERCTITSACRAIGIQLRDQGNIRDVHFRDITFASRFYSDAWWGLGEAISVTAIPRTPATRIGVVSDVSFRRISGRAENSIRVCGTPSSVVRNIQFEEVSVKIERWTERPGGRWDNRPTSAVLEIEPHRTSGFAFRCVDGVALTDCSVTWGEDRTTTFGHALECVHVTGLSMSGFSGQAAHPRVDSASWVIP